MAHLGDLRFDLPARFQDLTEYFFSSKQGLILKLPLSLLPLAAPDVDRWNNTKVVPIIFVPGVMGTRLNIDGTVFNWDPDDAGEMSGWVINQRRRELVRRVNASTKAEVARDLDTNTNPKSPNVDPRGDINKRSRMKQIAVDKLPIGVKRDQGDGTVPRPSAEFRNVKAPRSRQGSRALSTSSATTRRASSRSWWAR